VGSEMCIRDRFKSDPRNHFVIDKAGIQNSGLFRATAGGLSIESHADPKEAGRLFSVSSFAWVQNRTVRVIPIHRTLLERLPVAARLRFETPQIGTFGELWAHSCWGRVVTIRKFEDSYEGLDRLAGSSHDVVVHDMHKSEVASKAKQYGVRSVPAVVIDGKLAGCCAGRGPDEHVLRSALA